MLVSHALSYITASKVSFLSHSSSFFFCFRIDVNQDGLSYNELEDILSCDEEVLRDGKEQRTKR
jgi:hypothetical protein